MSYQILILRNAQKDLAALPIDIYEKIKNKIYALSKNPRPSGCKKLVARPAWRVRVGDYRIIYEINNKNSTITIIHIGHRKDIY